eukprot:Amastigsp_a845590_56.p2 type:complete len:238 gc:universal Amastigsp_a845590_56:1021-308(-)
MCGGFALQENTISPGPWHDLNVLWPEKRASLFSVCALVWRQRRRGAEHPDEKHERNRLTKRVVEREKVWRDRERSHENVAQNEQRAHGKSHSYDGGEAAHLSEDFAPRCRERGRRRPDSDYERRAVPHEGARRREIHDGDNDLGIALDDRFAVRRRLVGRHERVEQINDCGARVHDGVDQHVGNAEASESGIDALRRRRRDPRASRNASDRCRARTGGLDMKDSRPKKHETEIGREE